MSIRINPKIIEYIQAGDEAGDIDIKGKTPKETAMNFRKALTKQLNELRERRNDYQKTNIQSPIK